MRIENTGQSEATEISLTFKELSNNGEQNKFELDEIQDAFNMIVSRSESYNKVMFYPNGIE